MRAVVVLILTLLLLYMTMGQAKAAGVCTTSTPRMCLASQAFIEATDESLAIEYCKLFHSGGIPKTNWRTKSGMTIVAGAGNYGQIFSCAFDYVSGGTYQSPQNHWLVYLFRTPPADLLDVAKNNDCGDCAVTGPVLAGNPVNYLTGSKLETAVDFQAPTGGLEWKRYYSSQLPTHDTRTSLGHHWKSSLDRQVAVRDVSGVLMALVSRPSGDIYVYTQGSGGGWTSDTDIKYGLSPRMSGSTQTGWVVTTPDDTIESYGLDGKLIAITQVNGDEVSVTYTSGKPTALTDRHGRKITFTYTGSRLSSLILPDGNEIRYSFDSGERLTTVEYQKGVSGGLPQFDAVQYKYEDSARPYALTSKVDEGNNTYVSWAYDSTGKVQSTVKGNPSGNIDKLQFSYGPTGTVVTYPSGEAVTHTRLAQFGRAKLASSNKLCPGCASSSIASRTYDANGYADGATDFRGTTTDSEYNTRGLLTQKIAAANDTSGNKRTVQTDWHSGFRSPVERRVYNAAAALVEKSTWTYNARGQGVAYNHVDPLTSNTRSSLVQYCESGDVALGTCPLVGLVQSTNGARTDVADTTAFTYYATDDSACASLPSSCSHRQGDLWKVTNALGQVTETLAYDGAGRVLSVKDANGVVTDLEYHPRGWLTARKTRGANSSVETDDAITRIEYWPTGLVKKVIQPDGAFTSYTYDAAHRLTDILDNAG
ncbi:MAG TPA: DUF6531 domain-containing protein, partial [Pseudoxanthomonas sp.]